LSEKSVEAQAFRRLGAQCQPKETEQELAELAALFDGPRSSCAKRKAALGVVPVAPPLTSAGLATSVGMVLASRWGAVAFKSPQP
jgi:hypothetical protein